MSYILDALKKSEQERGHGNAPGVQTVHSASVNYHNEKKSYWPYILITAVILNLVAIIYFIVDKETQSGKDVVVTSPHNIDKPNKITPVTIDDRNKIITEEKNHTDKTTKTSSNTSSPITKPEIKNTFKPTISNSRNKTEPAPTEKEIADIIDYHDLHDSIKLQLPTITISAHVYSTNPAQRSIVINNKFLEEGEHIMDDLVLHEITPDGAILNQQGTLFHYGVVSSWQ